ncbi:putative paramyosin (Allergen Blo t 11) [Schistosoma mansoni]|uniref:putative paramyosin (Allergen Blo t 11) n=1 Tax=Schistosoma mansoni TaxID=6183 RepID=UPI00022DC138|nr:putative paramyosin (Allergen Blo t 11) [Schistosoma mansoni]|eukprot:XP_018648203.1 putative paramyosin (Allergen Blo t 11) [Schistosoma mansoni]
MVDYENRHQGRSPILPHCGFEIKMFNEKDKIREVQKDYNLSNKCFFKGTDYESIANSAEGKPRDKNLHVQLSDVKSQVEHFKTEFLRLNKERLEEQRELTIVVKSLRKQLEAVSQERDQEITKTSMESQQSGMQFQHLKYCVDQLLETNAEQERLMCAMNERLAVSNKEIGNYKLFLEYISSAIQKFDLNNNLTEPINLQIQDIEYVHSHFNKFLKTLEEKEHLRTIEIEKLKTTIDVMRSQNEAEIFRIEEKHKSSLQEQCEQLQDELNNTVVRAERATLEARTLSVEVANAKSKYEKEITEKCERIQELEKKLSDFTAKQNDSDINSRKALESVLDTTQKELIKMKCERDSATSQLSTLSAKLEATEVMKIISELKRKSIMNKENKAQTKLLKNQIKELNYELDKLKSAFKDNQRSINEYEKTLGSLLSDQRLTSVDYEKQANENAISEMKKQINESKSKCDRSSLRRESCETVSSDKIRENLKISQGNNFQRNISNAVKQSNAIFSLQQRLGNLEMNMYKVSEDKGNLQSQNEQLTDLLRRLTEQNQRLIKELDNRMMEATRDNKPATYSSQRVVEYSTEFQHNNNNIFYDYSNEQVKTSSCHNDKSVWNEEKFLDRCHNITNFNDGKSNKRPHENNEILTLSNQTLKNTSPVQLNDKNKLYYTQEQSAQSLKSDTTRTYYSVSDSAILSSQSNDSDELVSRETKVNNGESNNDVKYCTNQQNFKLDTKIPDQPNSPTPNIDVHITANNYKTFLNFNYQNTKGNTLKHETQYGKQLTIIDPEFKPTARELTSHNTNNNGIINWKLKEYDKSLEMYSDNEVTNCPDNTLPGT